MINISMDSQILSSLSGCPRLADYRFNRNLVSAKGKNNSLECGSLVHAIKEHYNKALIAGKKRNDAIDAGFSAFNEYLVPYKDTNIYIIDKDHPGLVNTVEKPEKKTDIGYAWVRETLVQYFDFYRGSMHTVIGAEETRKRVIYEDSELRVLWKAKYDEIDDTEGGIMSVDTKTSKQRQDWLSLDYQFMGQCVLLGSRNIIIDNIGFQTSLKPEEKFRRDVINYSADRLLEFQTEIVPHYARMLYAFAQADNFPPNFKNCKQKYGLCEFHQVCEADRNMREYEIKNLFVVGKKWDV